MRRRPTPPPIFAIADAEALAPRPLADAVEELADAGARWIELRAKRLPGGELHRRAEECLRRLEGSSVEVWIDDRVDLAAMLPFAGVWLGQGDLPPAAAREVVGDDVWIGRSTHDRRQLERADGDPEVDVVALGPIYPTTGKRDPDPVVGLDGLRRARSATGKPLVAIGGIDAGRLGEVFEAGADAAAMIGAVSGERPGEACRRLVELAGRLAARPAEEATCR